jgi:prophage regulatory protein
MQEVLLSAEDLEDLGVPYDPEHRRRLIAAGKFPQPIKLGGGKYSRNAWLQSEIFAWIKERAAARGQPVAEPIKRLAGRAKKSSKDKDSSSSAPVAANR